MEVGGEVVWCMGTTASRLCRWCVSSSQARSLRADRAPRRCTAKSPTSRAPCCPASRSRHELSRGWYHSQHRLGRRRATTSSSRCRRASTAVKVELTGFRTATREKRRAARRRADEDGRADGDRRRCPRPSRSHSIVSPTQHHRRQPRQRHHAAPRFARCRSRPTTSSVCSAFSPVPSTCRNTTNTDPRSGSVSGARADQSNVTLDGVDVNDPQFGTAYTSALRITTDALQEFRVTTSNYGADTGRSSAAQVSLVTKSGTNNFHGSGTYAERDTKFSSKEYFLGPVGPGQGEARQEDRRRRRRRADHEGQAVLLRQLRAAAGVVRVAGASAAVPSDSMRDGVLIYGCADPGAVPGDAACRASRARTRCLRASTA